MNTASLSMPASDAYPYQRSAYRYYVLGLLTLAYVFNFIDRQILAILQDPIKAEFGLSDAQLGLLTGFAFAAFYITFGLPIARWADRGNRRNIVSLAIGLWSLMTALCGMAHSYLQLLLARMGVGVGEAGGSPPAHSMISDIFPPAERATALGTYSIGVNIGVLAGFLAGGWLNEFFGWRVAFVAVGVPGILLALLIRSSVAEPLRGYSEGACAQRLAEGRAPSLVEVFALLWSRRSFRHLALGAGLVAFGGYSLSNWMPSFLYRSHGMSSGEIGTWLALIAGIGGGIGTFSGGYLADRLGRRDVRWYAWVPVLGIGATLPLLMLSLVLEDKTAALLCHVLPASLISMYLGPVLAVAHGLVDNRMRALSSAVLFLVLNLVGLGLGPLSVGVLSDLLRDSLGNESLRYALLSLISVAVFWGVVHFLLAARHLRREWLLSEQNA